jgi:hypothetical protein
MKIKKDSIVYLVIGFVLLLLESFVLYFLIYAEYQNSIGNVMYIETGRFVGPGILLASLILAVPIIIMFNIAIHKIMERVLNIWLLIGEVIVLAPLWIVYAFFKLREIYPFGPIGFCFLQLAILAVLLTLIALTQKTTITRNETKD